jgi:site-specific DNA-cytosine methylase
LKDVLVINTYGGSLLLAARGYKIRGSYEDVGYGSDIQADNFPGVNILRRTSEWPTQDLSETVVLAHPPCAAFSQQNNRRETKGLDAKKFQCTRVVLDYAMRNRAKAVLVESVMGALQGAWFEHESWANKYGYNLFRIVQNAASFGVPQLRPRFWATFIRSDVMSGRHLILRHEPEFKVIKDVVEYDEPFPTVTHEWEKQTGIMVRQGMDMKTVKKLARGKDYGGMLAVYRRIHEPETPQHEVQQRYLPKIFVSKTLRILDPNKPATVLLGDTTWVCEGKLLGAGDYKAVMGFPRDYRLPPKKATWFLSQGVCPPVAKWLLDEIKIAVSKKPRRARDIFDHTVTHNTVLDLRPEMERAPWKEAIA